MTDVQAANQAMATATPFVSVIIPAFNVAPYIEESLKSVLNQDGFDDFEVLVVDDRSVDGTAEVVLRLAMQDPRVRLLTNTGPKGAAGARNYGLAAAKGEWVAFLDGDDLWLPDNLSLKVTAARLFPDVSLVSSDFFNENRFNRSLEQEELTQARQSLLPRWRRHVGPPGPEGKVEFVRLRGLARSFLADDILGNTGTFFIRRDAIEDAGRFDTNLEVGEDVYLWLKLAQKLDDMVFVHKPLLFYRFRDGSLTNQNYPAHAFFADSLLKALGADEGFAPYRDLIRTRRSMALLTQSYYYRKSGHKRHAIKTAFQAWRLQPAGVQQLRNLLSTLCGV